MRLLVLLFVCLSLILCLLSTTTNYCYENIKDDLNSDLFMKSSQSSSENSTRISSHLSCRHSRGLSISALIFLSISLIILILSSFKSDDRLLAYLTVLFLFISSLLIILTYIFYPREKSDDKRGHSTDLMLIPSLLTILSMILTILLHKIFNKINIRSFEIFYINK